MGCFQGSCRQLISMSELLNIGRDAFAKQVRSRLSTVSVSAKPFVCSAALSLSALRKRQLLALSVIVVSGPPSWILVVIDRLNN